MSFSGTQTGASVALHLTGGEILTGTVGGSDLTIVLPSQQQTPEVLTLHQGTVDDYNTAVDQAAAAVSGDRPITSSQTIATAVLSGQPPSNTPYSISLSGGARCEWAAGPMSGYWGLPVSYACTDGTLLYGLPAFGCAAGSSCILGSKTRNMTTGFLTPYAVVQEGDVQVGDPRCAFVPGIQAPACYAALTVPTTQLTQCDAGFLGITYQEGWTHNGQSAVEITSVYPPTPAAGVGLQAHDLIVSLDLFDGVTVAPASGELAELLLARGPGGTVTFAYVDQGGVEHTVSVPLAKRPGC